VAAAFGGRAARGVTRDITPGDNAQTRNRAANIDMSLRENNSLSYTKKGDPADAGSPFYLNIKNPSNPFHPFLAHRRDEHVLLPS